MKTISFFGHSQIFDKHIIQEKLMETLSLLIKQGFTRFLVVCHGEFDELVLSTCLKYKKEMKSSVTINVVLTSLSFLTKNKYGYSKVDLYRDKDCQTIFYDVEDIHFKRRIEFSNKKMIDDSDLIICYVNMNSYRSGAKNAIEYAINQKKKIINLYNII